MLIRSTRHSRRAARPGQAHRQVRALLLAAYDEKAETFQSVQKWDRVYRRSFRAVLSTWNRTLSASGTRPRADRMDMDVWFEPKLVIEVIASEITLSRRTPRH